MHMLEKVYNRLGDAYYGSSEDDKKKLDPAILALLMQLLQMLMSGCSPRSALQFAQSQPIRGKAYIRLFLWAHGRELGGYRMLDIPRAVQALFLVAATATAEEAETFDSEMASMAA